MLLNRLCSKTFHSDELKNPTKAKVVCILLIQQILASSILRCTALFPTDPSPNLRCAVCPTHVSLLSFLSPSLFIHILSRFPLLSTHTHHQSQFTCYTLSNSLVMIQRVHVAKRPKPLSCFCRLFRCFAYCLFLCATISHFQIHSLK